jgi:hypothetical protein
VTEREVLALEPIADAPEVGCWLAAMGEGRRETLREIDGVTDDIVDLHSPGAENSIGTKLYHIVAGRLSLLRPIQTSAHPA